MRKLQRPPVSCPTLGAQGKGGKLAARQALEEPLHAGKDLGFPAHWNEPDVRGALYAMHGRSCAYCQSNLPQNDAGDVEHFRPKSIYWWLAYSFPNYFLSCGTCNRVRKRESFPLPVGSDYFKFTDSDRLTEEKFLLLNPEQDPVEDWVQVDFEDPICRVSSAGAPVGVEQAQRIEATIRFFKLNEYVPLIRNRFETVNEALESLKLARQGDTSQEQKVRKMASRYKPHGMAVRQMVAELAPEWLPSPSEELRWLIQDFSRDLHFAAKALANTPGSKVVKKTAEEVFWALAVLWKHPPVGSPAQVEAWLAAESWRDAVLDYYEKLPA
jgi:uncharacterized protein (TIGR02646 family)